MNLVSIILVFIAPLAFLIWTLRFKSSLVLLNAAPLLIIMVGILALNAEPTISFEVVDKECGVLLHNSTTTTTSNTTESTQFSSSLECNEQTLTVDYLLMAEVLTIVNYTTMIGVVSVAFVILYRIMQNRLKGD